MATKTLGRGSVYVLHHASMRILMSGHVAVGENVVLIELPDKLTQQQRKELMKEAARIVRAARP